MAITFLDKKKILRSLPIITLSSLIILFFSFPTYYAYKNTPEKMVFSGQAFWFDPWDVNVYVSAIRWSQNNGLNFQNAYTTQPHKSTVFYPFYTALGVSFPKANPFVLYHISLTVLSFCLLLIIYSISKEFLNSKNQAFLATILISLGGGFGWLFLPKIFLCDIGLTPFTFKNTFQRPHEVLAVIFYLLSFYLFFTGIKKRNLKKVRYSALSTCLLIFFYPFYTVPYYLVCGSYVLVSFFKTKKSEIFKYLQTIVCLTLPIGILYSLYLLNSEAFGGVIHFRYITPQIPWLVLGYGILSFFLIFQLFQKNKDSTSVFLNLWFFVNIFLTYLPLGFARYFLRTLFFPLVILTLKSINRLDKRFAAYKTMLLIVIILLTLPSNFVVSIIQIANAGKVSNRWYYLSKNEDEAVDFLNHKSPSGSGILSYYPIGNHLPAHTDNRVYYGHNHQTPNSKEKIENLNKFYANEYSNEEVEKFIKDNNISYVWWGRDEKEIANKNNEENLKYDFLKPVYTNSEVVIYSY